MIFPLDKSNRTIQIEFLQLLMDVYIISIESGDLVRGDIVHSDDKRLLQSEEEEITHKDFHFEVAVDSHTKKQINMKCLFSNPKYISSSAYGKD
jgi:hypothetical protein